MDGLYVGQDTMKSHRAYDSTGIYIGTFTASELYEWWSDARCERDGTDWSQVWIASDDCLLPPYEFLAVHDADFFRGDLDSFLAEFRQNTAEILSTLYSPSSLKCGPFQAKLHCSAGQRTVFGGYIPEDMEEEIDVYPIPFDQRHIQGIDPLDGEEDAIHCLRTSSLLVDELLVDDHDDDDELTCYTFSGDTFYYPTGIHFWEILHARGLARSADIISVTRWGQRPTPDVLLSYTSNRLDSVTNTVDNTPSKIHQEAQQDGSGNGG